MFIVHLVKLLTVSKVSRNFIIVRVVILHRNITQKDQKDDTVRLLLKVHLFQNIIQENVDIYYPPLEPAGGIFSFYQD